MMFRRYMTRSEYQNKCAKDGHEWYGSSVAVNHDMICVDIPASTLGFKFSNNVRFLNKPHVIKLRAFKTTMKQRMKNMFGRKSKELEILRGRINDLEHRRLNDDRRITQSYNKINALEVVLNQLGDFKIVHSCYKDNMLEDGYKLLDIVGDEYSFAVLVKKSNKKGSK